MLLRPRKLKRHLEVVGVATEIMAVRFVQVRQSRTDKESTMECNQGHPGGTLPVAAEMLSDDLCLTRTSNLPPALMQSDVLHVA